MKRLYFAVVSFVFCLAYTTPPWGAFKNQYPYNFGKVLMPGIKIGDEDIAITNLNKELVREGLHVKLFDRKFLNEFSQPHVQNMWKRRLSHQSFFVLGQLVNILKQGGLDAIDREVQYQTWNNQYPRIQNQVTRQTFVESQQNTNEAWDLGITVTIVGIALFGLYKFFNILK